MPCGVTQDGQVMVDRSDGMWSTGERNGKPLQYSFLENPMNSMKRGNTGGQYIREKMLNIAHYQRNPNQNYSEVSPHISQNGHHQNAGEDVEKREPSCTVGVNVN